MQAMVNYSKWDKLDLSDEEDSDGGGNKPRVHAFKGPQKVTIGGPNAGRGQVQVEPSEQAGQAEASDDEPMEPLDEDLDDGGNDEDHREDVLQMRALAERALRAGDPAEAVRLLEKSMRVGGASCPGLEDLLTSARRQLQQKQQAAGDGSTAEQQSAASSSAVGSGSGNALANGGIVGDRYCWSQTQETVEVNLFVPDGTKAKGVSINVSEVRLSISVGGSCLLEGEWEFKIAPEEDPDWEVRDLNGRRAVRLTVRKAVMPGGLSIVVWWKRVLKGEPEIDLKSIEGRKKERTESFAKAWEEAHLRFKEKAQNHVPIPIDVTGGGMGGVCDADMETS